MYLEAQDWPTFMHSGDRLVKLDKKLQIAIKKVKPNKALTLLILSLMG